VADLAYVALTAATFALALVLLKVCERIVGSEE